MDIDKEKVGRRINEIRMRLKLTLEEFAFLIQKESDNKIKTTKSNVSKWEKGYNLPNDITLNIIADIANIRIEYLLYGTQKELLLDTLNILVDNNSDSFSSILYDEIIDYLMEYDDLFEISTGFFVDESGSLVDEKTQSKMLDEYTLILVKEFINTNFNEFFNYLCNVSSSQNYLDYNLLLNKDYVIEKFTNYMSFKKRATFSTFEGNSQTIITNLQKLSPVAYNNFDSLDDFINSYKNNPTINKDTQYIIDEFYLNLLREKVFEFTKELRNLQNEYKQVKKEYLE